MDALAEAVRPAGKPLKVVVDFDVGQQRTGVPSPDEALAQRIAGSSGLHFAGVQAYAGQLQHIADYTERRDLAAVRSAEVRELKDKLDKAGLNSPIVSGAGTHEIDARCGEFTELQTGSYIFTDVEYNAVALRENTPWSVPTWKGRSPPTAGASALPPTGRRHSGRPR